MQIKTFITAGFCSFVAFSIPQQIVAIERDARFIVGLGYDYSEIEDSDSQSYGASAEIALTKKGTFGLLLGAGALKGDSFYAPDGQYFNAGVSWYPTRALKLSLLGFYNKIEGQDAYYGYSYLIDSIVYGVWDTEIETQGLSLTAKYFIFQQSPRFTPFILASIGYSKTEADATDGTVGWDVGPGRYYINTGSRYQNFPASTAVEYDFDNTFRWNLGAGFDFMLSETVSLSAAAAFGVLDQGGSYYVKGAIYHDTKFSSQDSFYTIGGSVRFFL